MNRNCFGGTSRINTWFPFVQHFPLRTYGGKGYTNFRGLNVPEDDIGCKSFIVISIDSLLAYDKKYYLQVYVDNCACKTVNKQMTDYLDENIFED